MLSDICSIQIVSDGCHGDVNLHRFLPGGADGLCGVGGGLVRGHGQAPSLNVQLVKLADDSVVAYQHDCPVNRQQIKLRFF